MCVARRATRSSGSSPAVPVASIRVWRSRWAKDSNSVLGVQRTLLKSTLGDKGATKVPQTSPPTAIKLLIARQTCVSETCQTGFRGGRANENGFLPNQDGPGKSRSSNVSPLLVTGWQTDLHRVCGVVPSQLTLRGGKEEDHGRRALDPNLANRTAGKLLEGNEDHKARR